MTVLLFLLVPIFCILVPIRPKFDIVKLYYQCQEWETPDTDNSDKKVSNASTQQTANEKTDNEPIEPPSDETSNQVSSSREPTPEEIAKSIYWEDL